MAGANSPNVLLIMADDLGYHDLSSYGHPKIKSPVLDGFAKEGVKLTSFYAGATVCTPSRMALLTGAYPPRLGWTKGVVGHIMKKGTGLSPDALTMAEVFQAKGYRTGLVGKWHLGDEKPFRPHRQGFESTYYINKSNNQTNEIWRGDEVVEKPFVNKMLTEQFTSEAVKFVGAKDERPFFLFLSYSAPHFPIEPHPKWKGKSEFGDYGDVVEEMDGRIGDLLAVLKKRGLEKNTIVVFLSDNGPEPLTKESKADPFRGKKWSALEGGTRVPCMIRWPGQIPAGSTRKELIAAIDIFPTLAAACDISLKNYSKGLPAIDGVSVLGTLQQKKIKHARKDLLFWHGSDGFQAIRVGSWKAFRRGKDAGLKGAEANRPVLFDLSKDITESKNVAEENQERLTAMLALAEARMADIERAQMSLGGAKE